MSVYLLTVSHDKDLDNFISTHILNKNIIHVNDFYQRSNWIISDFRACSSITLDDLHKTFGLHYWV